MAAKRFFDDSNQDKDKPNDKRIRTTTTRPSFASVIGEVVMVKNMQNLFSGLEPLLRRVVNEEMERAIMRQSFSPSPSILRLEAMEQQSSSYQLMFKKKLSLPIFTGSKILDVEGNPIQVILVDNQMVPPSLPHPIKLEIVVLDGDFPETWNSEVFNSHIVKERTGKRPLLTGELNVTMRNGIAPIGDLEFTDNSSWIRSRKFRVAVRMAPAGNNGTNPSLPIREGMTESFIVKDHRGELYKKHHPPILNDEVWRLEKIGKDGAFHKKLSIEGINTVQDFLKLSVVDPHRLRKILGIGMSEKMWDVTIKHAKTCNMGNKLYIYRIPHSTTIYLNAMCQLVRADINGQTFLNRDLNNINRSYIEKLVREAYIRWNDLEEIDGVLNDNNVANLLTQGETMEQFPNNEVQAPIITYDQSDYVVSQNTQSAYEWPAFSMSPLLPFSSFSESQSDGDITPSGSGSGSGSGSDIDGAPRWH